MESPLQSGRTAASGTLSASLASAPVPFLEGALANQALTPGHLHLILRNPAITSSLLDRISRSPFWMKFSKLRAAIVLHPRTPRLVSMKLIPGLGWHDLARVAAQPALPPPVRRAAEFLLGVRVRELTLGERVALARIASHGVIRVLLRDESPRVLEVLLKNPRIVEEDAVAILRNPRTPIPAALHLVHRLGFGALRGLAQRPGVPPLISVAAGRLIEARRPHSLA